MNRNVKKWTVLSGGIDNFTMLEDWLNISFYELMQYKLLWRSKFRIRIKETDKNRNLRISHTSSKLYRVSSAGSITKTNLRKIAAITDKVW